jgi:hypothetical protein
VLTVSSILALMVGFSGAGNAQVLDRPGHRAAKGAAKNANAPRTFVAPKGLPKGGAAGVRANRAVTGPNPGAVANPGMTRAANPALNGPHPTAATRAGPQVTNAVDPRRQLHPAVRDPSRRLNNTAANPRAPLTGANVRQNPGINPRGAQQATRNPQGRFNPADPRNRFNGANNPRARFGPGSRQGGVQATAGPRGRLQGPADYRTRLIAAHDYRRALLDHRRMNFLARAQLPIRPYFGQRGFTGVPPVGERRYVTNQVMFHVGSNVPRAQVEAIMRRHGMTLAASESMSLTGGTMFHVRVAGNKAMAEAVRDLEAENIGLAQPNYVFHLMRDLTVPGSDVAPIASGEADAQAPELAASDQPKDTTLAARPAMGDPSQYVVNKLKLGDVHRIATGSNVLVAVIDSRIDAKHPDLASSIVEQYDATGRNNRPDSHGTGMAGAIAAQRKLLGVAPGAKILAINAFSPDAGDSPQATTQHILAGLEYAIKRGARVINMSFAGPYDPVLQLAMKKAREKGVVLIAAAGNAGPKSPPLFPAADPNVIAVTATDSNDKVFAKANRGPQIALAAPGVEIIEPAPNGGYQLTTGTSVAAAHVSGVAALLIERNPTADPAAIEDILTMSAKTLAPGGRNDDVGWGLVDPTNALGEMDAKVARDRDFVPGKPLPALPAPTAARTVPVSTR